MAAAMSEPLVQQLREENELLRERVRQLEEALVPPSCVVPKAWGLTGKEARVFAHLTTRNIASRQSIMMALYSDRLEEPDAQVITTYICKLRAKLKPFGVTITNVWGQGYSLANRTDYLPPEKR